MSKHSNGHLGHFLSNVVRTSKIWPIVVHQGLQIPTLITSERTRQIIPRIQPPVTPSFCTCTIISGVQQTDSNPRRPNNIREEIAKHWCFNEFMNVSENGFLSLSTVNRKSQFYRHHLKNNQYLENFIQNKISYTR